MARTLSLKAGSKIFCGTVEYEIIEPASLTTLKVRDVVNGAERIISLDDITGQSSAEESPGYMSLDCLSEDEQKQALQRFNMIKPAIVRDLSRKEIEELAAKHGVHFSTIYRLIRQFRETMSPASLVPKTANRGGKGKSRIDDAVEKVISDHFTEIYEKKDVDITMLKVTALQKDIKKKCKRLGIKVPSWKTVNNRLDLFIQEKKLAANRKRKGGRARTMAGGMFPDADGPLDVVQIDHTHLDLIVVDDEHRESIGRPYLSLAIDVFSRMVVGFSLSLDPPNIFSVGKLISHCILPKTQFLNQVGVDANWDIYGVMGMIHLDNAGEFRAEDFVPFQNEYMVEIRWRPVASPQYGGHIERLAETLNDAIHEEPGSTMGDIITRAGYDSEGKACYTLDEIEKWLTILITKIYHLEDHSALTNSRGEKLNPIEKYEIGVLGDDKNLGYGLPEIVEDQERLKIFLLPSIERTVQREGVKLDHIYYFHDILRSFYGHKDSDGKAKKFLVKRDPRRISPLFFFDPAGKKFFPIPYRDLTRPPMNLWELKEAQKRCKEKGINNPNEQQIFNAYDELRAIRDEAVAKTKKAKRERQAAKRRKKDTPITPQFEEGISNDIAPPSDPVSDEDMSSFYDDLDILSGVTVGSKKNRRDDE